MTEKEKQQAGELYLSSDPELTAERVKAKKLCVEYNNIPCNDYCQKTRLLDRLVALRGENTVIDANFSCDYGYNIIIGDNFRVGQNCVIIDSAEVVFGNNIIIGPNCGFYTVEQALDYPTRNKGLEYAKPIKVGSNVYIGGNVCVLPGVTIGDNVVIGAGSVVVEDIPSNTMAAGNPCKPVKAIEVPVEEKPEEAAEEKTEEKTDAKAEEKPAKEKKPEKKQEKKPVVKVVEVNKNKK